MAAHRGQLAAGEGLSSLQAGAGALRPCVHWLQLALAAHCQCVSPATLLSAESAALHEALLSDAMTPEHLDLIFR